MREGFSSRQLYLVPSLRFSCSAVVNQWLVYFESNGDCFVQFQVWRQDSTENCTSGRFNLVGQNNFSLTASKSLHNITPPAEDMIQVQPGDIVGFLTEFSNNRNRRSVQTNPNAGGVTFVVDGVRPQNNLGTVIMSTQDTCSLGTDNGVPLLTTMVTPGEETPITVFAREAIFHSLHSLCDNRFTGHHSSNSYGVNYSTRDYYNTLHSYTSASNHGYISIRSSALHQQSPCTHPLH